MLTLGLRPSRLKSSGVNREGVTPAGTRRLGSEWVIAGVVLLTLAVSGCSTDGGRSVAPPLAPTSQNVATAGALVAFNAGVSAFADAWNGNQLRWVAALSDTAVSYEEFLSIQHQVEVDQSKLVAEFGLTKGSYGPELALSATVLETHYQERLQALHNLFSASAVGTEADFNAALVAYQALLTPASLRQLFTEVYSQPSIQDQLAAEGVTVEQLVEAVVGLVPQ